MLLLMGVIEAMDLGSWGYVESYCFYREGRY